MAKNEGIDNHCGDGVDMKIEIERPCGSVATIDLRFATGVWLLARKRVAMIKDWNYIPVLPLAESDKRKAVSIVKKLLHAHPLWPWLDQFPGLGGAQVAWIIARISDPHRFPRPGELGNGTRALWHYLGLYPGGRRIRGLSTSYCTQAKGLLVGEMGIADSIVIYRPQPYRRIYEEYKERRIARIEAEGGVVIRGKAPDWSSENAQATESLPSDKGGAEIQLEVEVRDGTPLIYIERVAKTVAVKAFVADMLQEWKRVEPKVV